MEEEMKIESATEKKEKKKKAVKTDKKTRRTKFNFLDAIIIVMVLAVMILIAFVYSPARMIGTGSEEVTVIYTIKISGVSADYAAAISVGDPITDENGYSLGNVASDVEVEPYMTYEYIEKEDGNGTIVSVKHPDLVNLLVTISAKADLYEDGYYLDGMRIAVEGEYQIILPGFESKGVCIAISEEKANEAGAK